MEPIPEEACKKLEKVQKYATRHVPEVRGLNYEKRLIELNLATLENRRIREDILRYTKRN